MLYLNFNQLNITKEHLLNLINKGFLSEQANTISIDDINDISFITTFYINTIVNSTNINEIIKLCEDYSRFLFELEKKGRFWSFNVNKWGMIEAFNVWDTPDRSKKIRFTKLINKHINWNKNEINNYKKTLLELIDNLTTLQKHIEIKLKNMSDLLNEEQQFQLGECIAVCKSGIFYHKPLFQQIDKRKDLI